MTQPSAEVAAEPRLRLEHVDGLRALAALTVFVNHAYGQTWNPYLDQYSPGWLSFLKYSLVMGHLSVTVFIVVSGFCLTLPVIPQGGELRGGVRGFLKRRARRILPPYYAALTVCVILIWTILREPTGSIWDVPLRATPSSVLVHFVLLQDFFATGHINYVFWSIAVEWHIYFVMPLMLYCWRRFGASAVVLGALGVGYALMLGLSDTRIARANPHYLGMFALGMLAAYLARSKETKWIEIRDRVPWALAAALLLLGTVGAIVFRGLDPSLKSFAYLDLPIGLMTASALVASSKPEAGRLTRFLSFRPLVLIGTFSYSLYLMHAPLLQFVWHYVFDPLGLKSTSLFVALMTAGLASILGVSYLFHLAFEAPFMGPAKSRRRTEPAVVPTQ